MSVVITETDYGTKEKLKQSIEEGYESMIEEVSLQLDMIWEKIKETAVELCPKDTGALASSIKVVSGAEAGGYGIHATLASEIIYDAMIVAGDPTIINPKTGKPTSEYAIYVHEGHRMRDGTFWEGVPFLVEAILMHMDEIEKVILEAIDKGLHV